MRPSDFPPKSYVVTFGWRIPAGQVVWSLLVAVAMVGCAVPLLFHQEWFTGGFLLAVFTLIQYLIWGDLPTTIRMRRRHEVAFAISAVGVYFGPSDLPQWPIETPQPELVTWDRISSVELFRHFNTKSGTKCVAVRTPADMLQVHLVGSHPLATQLDAETLKLVAHHHQESIIPGSDGTYRIAYRYISGWSMDEARLRQAVAHFAPQVPVIRTRDWLAL